MIWVYPSSFSINDLLEAPEQTAPNSNRESPAQFENQIKPQVYVRRITRSTLNVKKLHFIRRNWCKGK